jgi:hypothetical protein
MQSEKKLRRGEMGWMMGNRPPNVREPSNMCVLNCLFVIQLRQNMHATVYYTFMENYLFLLSKYATMIMRTSKLEGQKNENFTLSLRQVLNINTLYSIISRKKAKKQQNKTKYTHTHTRNKW